MKHLLTKNNLKVVFNINMEKKKRELSVTKRFNENDVKKWQEAANLSTGGNLNLWMENKLNEAAKKDLKLSEKGRV
jgi:hypothetical protein